jgi:DNA-binding CsgD family transcriptional regulator
VKERLPSKEITKRLFISIHTVNTHRQWILEKLNVSNSYEAIQYAARLGLLE